MCACTLSKFCRNARWGGNRLCVATAKREQRPPIFYRVQLKHMTGHRATPDPVEAEAFAAEETAFTDRL
jgi:hypothetical protein